MPKSALSASVKTRISPEAKNGILAIAAARELGEADIVREALRDYLKRNRPAPAGSKGAA